jgi:type VI secretion system secreted protein VgrG
MRRHSAKASMSSDTTRIPGNRHIGVALNDTLSVGADRIVKVRAKASTTVDGELTLRVGKAAVVEVGKGLVIEAEDSIELRVGLASLVLKKDGSILLSGRDISIKGSGKVNVKSGSDTALSGGKIGQN